MRKIICPILYLVFAKYYTADEFLGSGRAVDIGIVFLEEIFEMQVMILWEFYEKDQVRIRVFDCCLDSGIVCIVFVDIGIQNFKGRGIRVAGREFRLVIIETIEGVWMYDEKDAEGYQ